MKNEQYKYDVLKEFGISEEELVRFVRETLETLEIPYTNTPGKFVFGESMFGGANVMPYEEVSLQVKTTVREAAFSRKYSFVSIENTPVCSWNMNNPVLDYPAAGISAA